MASNHGLLILIKVLGLDVGIADGFAPRCPVHYDAIIFVSNCSLEGKIKRIGLCKVPSTALRRAVKIAPVAAVQVEYSPFVREIENSASQNLLATCRKLGIAIVCYCPLGRCLLTGNITSHDSFAADGTDLRSTHFPWFTEEKIAANVALVERFKGFAEKKGVSVGGRGFFFSIPGMWKVKYLEDNWGGKDVVLGKEEVAEIRMFVEENEVNGYRSVEMAKSFAYVDTREE
ncbi:Aldo/keto reductase [Lentithecium fluviatile CBS 122367]|uniref:Aldo/keto reductase n=1 Tax=Lentithecium fluviatile CBS 122367 TaxID=1168545 RepID=A0A6G1ILC2_9PLEO|nr:Aldo/keto reductase [Lentithecium fluviatile CBS 122367]